MKLLTVITGLLCSVSAMAMNASIIQLTGDTNLTCESLQDLNLEKYVVTNPTIEADDFYSAKVRFNVQFEKCVERGEGVEFVKFNQFSRAPHQYASSYDRDGQAILSSTYDQMLSIDFYAIQNELDVLDTTPLVGGAVELNVDLTKMLSDDEIFDIINGEEKKLSLNVSPRIIKAIFNENGERIDVRNSMWNEIKLDFKVALPAPGNSF